MKFEGEYLNGYRWNGKSYNRDGNIISEIKSENGKDKEYNYFYGKIIYDGEHLNEERDGKTSGSGSGAGKEKPH